MITGGLSGDILEIFVLCSFLDYHDYVLMTSLIVLNTCAAKLFTYMLHSFETKFANAISYFK